MIFFLSITFLVVAIDFYTKYLVTQNMVLGESIPILSGYLNLTYVRNPGAAFGFLAEVNSPWKPFFFWVVSAVAIIVLVYYYVNTPSNDFKTRLALTLIFGGAFGNMIDRFRWGEVVDFIDAYLGKYHWPAFNVADSCICIGMGVLVYSILIDAKNEKD